MKSLNIISELQSNITTQNIKNLRKLGGNLVFIKRRIETEIAQSGKFGKKNSDEWKKTCARELGNFFEHIILSGAALNVPFFTQRYGKIRLYEWDKKNCQIGDRITKMEQVSGGSSKGGEIDILFRDEEDHIFIFSAKFRKMYGGEIDWGDLEIKQMSTIYEDYDKQNVTKGAFIYDKNHLKNKVSEYEEVVLYDFDDLKEIWSQVYSVLLENDFDISKLNHIIDSEKLSLELRYHQINALNDAVNYWKSGAGKYFLFDHICRSGKTITALATCKAMGFQNILLLTSFPCVNEMEWEDTINTFSMFDLWNNNFVDFSRKIGEYKEGEANFVAISLQDLKSNDYGNNLYGMQKKKFDNIRNQKWDCVIVDEVHYGYETDKSLNIMDELDFDYCLALSATPFVNYFKGTFNASNTNRWTLMDEVKRAKDYPKSVYADYPNMNFLLFAPPSEIFENYEFDSEEGLTFKKFLRLNEDGDFYYQRDVNNVVDFIFDRKNGKKSKTTPFGNARINGMSHIGEGILIFVPETKHCRPLKKMLKENEAIKERYGDNVVIDFTYSDKNSSPQLKNWLKKKTESGKPFIIIAVNQLTTGVTISNVDTVILMNDGESPQDLMQRMFRCRTAKKGKKDAFVIDLNPSRTFRMVYEYCSTIAEERNLSHNDVFKEYFDLIQIFYHNGYKFVDVKEELNDIFESAASRYYDFFNKQSIINDELNDDIIDSLNEIEIGELEVFDDGKKKYEKGGGTKGKTEKGSKNNGGSDSESEETELEEKKKKNRLQDAREKLFLITKSICWASIFCRCQFDTYAEIFGHLDENKKIRNRYNKLVYDKQEKIFSGKEVIYMLDKCTDGKILNTIIAGFNNRFKEDPLKMDMSKLPLAEKFKKVFGEVFTPISLVEEMLDKLPKEVWSEKDYKWCDPACGSGNFLLVVKKRLMEGLKNVIVDEKERERHILENMIYGVDIQERNVALCDMRLDMENEYKTNIEAHDSLEFDFWGLKFDVVVGNPPYNPPLGIGTGASIWDKFVKQSLDKLLIDDRFLCFVHPAKWRKPDNELWKKMTKYQIHYLEIHDAKDGNKIFGANTRYDFYVLQKTLYNKKTIMVDEKGKNHNLDLREWPWLPNYNYDNIKNILDKDGNNEVIYSTLNDFKDKKDDVYKYKCIHTVTKTNDVRIKYSKIEDENHIGVSKIIFSDGGSVMPVLDLEGKFGMTQQAIALPISDTKTAECIKKALESNSFNEIIQATKWSLYRTEWRMFKYFKKDFWKEFIKKDDSKEDDNNE